MNKVVINSCYGGFSLSSEAERRYNEVAKPLGAPLYGYFVSRHCPILIGLVEEMGAEANGFAADLQIKEIEGDRYRIDEYDGRESVIVPEKQRWITIG